MIKFVVIIFVIAFVFVLPIWGVIKLKNEGKGQKWLWLLLAWLLVAGGFIYLFFWILGGV